MMRWRTAVERAVVFAVADNTLRALGLDMDRMCGSTLDAAARHRDGPKQHAARNAGKQKQAKQAASHQQQQHQQQQETPRPLLQQLLPSFLRPAAGGGGGTSSGSSGSSR